MRNGFKFFALVACATAVMGLVACEDKITETKISASKIESNGSLNVIQEAISFAGDKSGTFKISLTNVDASWTGVGQSAVVVGNGFWSTDGSKSGGPVTVTAGNCTVGTISNADATIGDCSNWGSDIESKDALGFRVVKANTWDLLLGASNFGNGDSNMFAYVGTSTSGTVTIDCTLGLKR